MREIDEMGKVTQDETRPNENQTIRDGIKRNEMRFEGLTCLLTHSPTYSPNRLLSLLSYSLRRLLNLDFHFHFQRVKVKG
jgi:hypothetical protein